MWWTLLSALIMTEATMRRGFLLMRFWLGDSVMAIDHHLHDKNVPGRWWCDLADAIFWRIWRPASPS